uniref:Putative gibberellin 2-beta-dioxygenase 2-like n=1 Tax=Davidia involucrata TaxID=16924 RepID=A0A5B7CFT7_DAVIN
MLVHLVLLAMVAKTSASMARWMSLSISSSKPILSPFLRDRKLSPMTQQSSEYGMGDMVALQGDVYSYGILLLEMFTGKKPIDDAFKDDLSLHNFVKSALPDQVMEILDPRILLEHEARSTIKNCMVWVLRIGVACSVQSPRDRMEMGEVVSELCKIRDVYKHEVLNHE